MDKRTGFISDGLRLTDFFTSFFRGKSTETIPKTIYPLTLMEDSVVIWPFIYSHSFSLLENHKPI